jgi:hypothetical protein
MEMIIEEEQTSSLVTPSINAVYEVRAQAQEGVYIVFCNITDMYGATYDCEYATSPDDTFGLNPMFRQWLVDHQGEYVIVPYIAPPPAPYNLQIATLWDRLSEDEAEMFDTAVATASPLKMRKQFLLATSMMSDSELFAWVKSLLVGLFGEARATELLAQ